MLASPLLPASAPTITPDTIEGFRAWAASRGYSPTSINSWTRMARRLAAATRGAPLPSSPEAAADLITNHRAPIRGTIRACQTGIRRFYEYLGRDA